MSDPIRESFIPLSEKAVRRDGTIGIKLIAPGWGSSGYYPAQVLERDAPRVFPPGTQMFWNHDTAMEEAERPEGDLSRLAAVITSIPRYETNGVEGAGVYADARVMAGYAPVIDDIAEAIGLSIRAAGSYNEGEAEGRYGRIIQELTHDPRVGSRVDFVTKPGAGGRVLSIFESAPHAPKLPGPIDLGNAFVNVTGSSATSGMSAYRPVTFASDGVNDYVPFSDGVHGFLVEAGRVLSRANETKLKAALEQLTAVLSMLGNDEEMTSESARDTAVTFMEADMNEQELKEAQAALTKSQNELAESKAALLKMQEQLLLRESRDFVTAALGQADLPDITKTRLSGQLSRNPAVKEGRIDEAEMSKRVETAVTEAQAEIAAILGSSGQITGMGESSNGDRPQVDVTEARRRIDAALAEMGHGGKN